MTPTYAVTYSGKKLDLQNPTPEMIDIDDIAHGLSNTCRYGGQCDFYSVAQHSVLMSLRVHAEYRGFTSATLLEANGCATWALLHDAAEAYVGDMPAPIKALVGGDGFNRLEARVSWAITEKLNAHPRACHLEAVKEADMRMRATEAKFLWPPGQEPDLGLDPHVLPYDGMVIEGWDPQKAKGLFLGHFRYLKQR